MFSPGGGGEVLPAYFIDAQKSLEHKSEVQNFWMFSVRVFLDVLFRVFSFSKASSFNALTFSFITF